MATPEKRRPKFTQLRSLLVQHTAYESTLKEVCAMIDLAGDGVAPIGCQPILGPPDVGKSTLIEMLAKLYPREEGGVAHDGEPPWTADRIPLLSLQMPAGPRVITVLRAILRAIGDPCWNKGREEDLKERLGILIERCAITAIVFDDAQRAVDRFGRVTQDKLVELIKDIFDHHCIAIILIGLPRTRLLFQADDQFDRRFLSEIGFEPYRWGDPASRSDPDLASRDEFIALLDAFLRSCPIPMHADIDVEDDVLCLRFFCASRGLVGRLKRLLMVATQIAEQRASGTIGMAMLGEAFERTFRKDPRHGRLLNPFTGEWDGRLPPLLPEGAPKPARSSKAARPQKKSRRYIAQAALSPQ